MILTIVAVDMYYVFQNYDQFQVKTKNYSIFKKMFCIPFNLRRNTCCGDVCLCMLIIHFSVKSIFQVLKSILTSVCISSVKTAGAYLLLHFLSLVLCFVASVVLRA